METDFTYGWCCIDGDEREEEEENHDFVEGEHCEGFGGVVRVRPPTFPRIYIRQMVNRNNSIKIK